jgi:hypothetical protein
MSTSSIRNTLVYNIENSISSLEDMPASEHKYPALHPVHNPKRMQQLHDLLESIRNEFQMVTWNMLFAVPERQIVITVPDQVNGVHARIAILEKYLCANSKLEECVGLDPDSMQPEKLYTMEAARAARVHNTFRISHKNHEPRLSVIADWQYQQIPPNSDNYFTTITYYCSFIDEEPIVDTIQDEAEPTAVNDTVVFSAPSMSMSTEEAQALLSQNMSKRPKPGCNSTNIEEGPFK